MTRRRVLRNNRPTADEPYNEIPELENQINSMSCYAFHLIMLNLTLNARRLK